MEAGTHDLDHGVALARSALRVDLVHADRCVEEATVAASLDIREDTLVSASTVLGRRLDDHFRRLDCRFTAMPDVTLTP